ncbi:RcnB family protein [Rhodanobacter koreensis]
MKKQWGTWLICSALLMSTSAVVMAQPQGQDHRDQGHQDQGHQDQNHRSMYERGHSEGWYKKGGHMPAEYRGGSYVVSNWQSEHLRAPPRGYHYVRSDNGDFILVAITTGVIAGIIAAHH